MEILIDGTLVAQGTAASISYSWITLNAGNGSHTIQVRAYDAANNIGTGSSSVTVQNSAILDTIAPVTAITSPTEGAVLGTSTKVYVTSNDNIAVKRVDLYLDGTLFGSSTSSQPVFNWNTRHAAKGAHKLQAYAYDAAGNVGPSSLVTVYR
jgi:hypothetical protein